MTGNSLYSPSSSTTTGDPWTPWNIVYVTNSTSSTTTLTNCSTTGSTLLTSNTVWPAWNDTYTTTCGSGRAVLVQRQISVTSTGATTLDIWGDWNERLFGQQVAVPRRRSAEEQRVYDEQRRAEEARWRAAAEEERRERVEAEAKWKAAEQRAERLLEQVLDDQQRRDYREKGHFYLLTNGKRYKVHRGWAGNVQLVDEQDKPLSRFCIHPRVRVPDADNLVAQKLLLEHDEQEFRRVANETRYG